MRRRKAREKKMTEKRAMMLKEMLEGHRCVNTRCIHTQHVHSLAIITSSGCSKIGRKGADSIKIIIIIIIWLSMNEHSFLIHVQVQQ